MNLSVAFDTPLLSFCRVICVAGKEDVGEPPNSLKPSKGQDWYWSPTVRRSTRAQYSGSLANAWDELRRFRC